MKFVYGKQDMPTLLRSQETCWLLTNGLGGYASASAAWSVTRCDQGLLVGARTAPNDRVTLVHRLSERLIRDEEVDYLSTQEFADGTPPEEGCRHLSSFVWENGPVWTYEVRGVRVTRRVAIAQGSNTAAVLYRMENTTQEPCVLEITPWLSCVPRGMALQEQQEIRWRKNRLGTKELNVCFRTTGNLEWKELTWQTLAYRDDEKDGRTAQGLAASHGMVWKCAKAGETIELELVVSTDPIRTTGSKLLERQTRRQKQLERQGGFRHPAARQLAKAAADYVADRWSTGGKTLLAGFPYFGDWGRDTMIALPGCVLAREDYETARSILRTFLAYEQDGLVPNLFPEGESLPQYNTVDAALLLINSIWLYVRRTGDRLLLEEAWPVMERIIAAYEAGTHHGIHMDTDGLICAGQGLDQVTWMDVCVDGILPTPRHGKPVEINAYWYNALRILEAFAPEMGTDGSRYGSLAEQVKKSFREKFWMGDRGWLKDVLSGTAADTQLRCNQIWAVTMPFTMLDPEQERSIVDTVYRQLYTPCGLRSLSPEDPEFHPTYGGPQKDRDLAYHQGTVWVFPLGAYYLAYLKVHGYSQEARRTVLTQLEPIEAALREGCVGQLPEIYDGLNPGPSQGCFAQAWSVGELLRVYEALEKGAV